MKLPGSKKHVHTLLGLFKEGILRVDGCTVSWPSITLPPTVAAQPGLLDFSWPGVTVKVTPDVVGVVAGNLSATKRYSGGTVFAMLASLFNGQPVNLPGDVTLMMPKENQIPALRYDAQTGSVLATWAAPWPVVSQGGHWAHLRGMTLGPERGVLDIYRPIPVLGLDLARDPVIEWEY